MGEGNEKDTAVVNNPCGSLWRRWDLHIHTPGTKLSDAFGDNASDEVWNRYIDALEESPVQVFGITDYFSCNAYFELLQRFQERKPDSTKIFFPNIEFRLSESISKDGSHPNIHVIFDNAEDISNDEVLSRFLTNMETQTINDANAKTRCSDLKVQADYEAATVSLDSLTKALKDTFGNIKPYLIAFPANNDGLRSTDSKSPRKVALADRIDRTCNLFFGNENNRDFLLRSDRYEQGEAKPKPVVSCSDAHAFDDLERLSGDVAGFPPTWIKADPTFAGLQQICHEPESRVHIGVTPDVMTRQDQDGTKFVKMLQIDQSQGYDERNGKWFKAVEIPFNPELTAIIGNKGSGKSAIVDIIGLLGNSRQEAYFSFLTDESKSKKFRQRGYAENFKGSLTWLTDRRDEKQLDEHCDVDRPENVRYLPQNYFEQLTNEIEIEQFRREIEEVVFSHVDETETLGKSSFSELEETKTLQSKQEISSLKTQLRELNIEIVRLEERSSPNFRKQLESSIESKQHELDALDKAKPTEVKKPDTETPEQLALAKEVDQLTTLLEDLRDRGQETVNEISAIKAKLQDAVSLQESLSNIEASHRGNISELEEKLTMLGLKANDLISFSINFEPLEQKLAEFKEAVSKLETDNEVTFTPETNFPTLLTLPDLRAAYTYVNTQIKLRKEQLSTPQRRYQNYVEQLNAWTNKRSEIAGVSDDPKPDTLAFLGVSLKHIKETLSAQLEAKLQERTAIVKSIFESKNTVLNFYSELKLSVEGRLQSVRAEGFEIEIDASFVVDRDFRREFLNHINQRKKGHYRNDLDAQQEITRRIQETDWNDCEAVIAFCQGLLDRMKEYNGEELAVTDQAHDVKELYDFLFSLDYLSSRYELRLGGKNLNELSPGEKGLLLLIFYLQLDRKNTPLVIDQPEDNLDNDSIFKVLAKCIRDAKKHRQVILVTHNPNLAVGADAEQIIYVKLEKSQEYKFSYETGAIENPQLNSRVVDVLEGSQPAFVKRRLKYGI